MSKRISIKSPQKLHVKTGYGTSYGANQNWYGSFRKRMSGCGPTTATNLLIYSILTNPKTKNLCPYYDGKKNTALRFMDEVWDYVTPGLQGLNKLSMFTDGVYKFAKHKGVDISCSSFAKPKTAVNPKTTGNFKTTENPTTVENPKTADTTTNEKENSTQKFSKENAVEFIKTALSEDSPVAFLNLNNGKVHGLQNWHWVSILSANENFDDVELYDEGHIVHIDLSRWLSLSNVSGGFIRID